MTTKGSDVFALPTNSSEDSKILTVQLHRMNSTHIDKAVKLFLDELNKTETLFPGTDIKIRYKLAE